MAAETAVRKMAQLTVEPMLGGISIAGLGALADPNHEANKAIEFECSQGCGTKLEGRQFWASMTACDSCREKAERKEKLDRAKTYWEAICPESFRETDKTHAGFPKGQYEATKAFCGEESLLLFGPSGKGKTRLGMLLLKRCLVRFNKHVGVMWPEALKAVKGQRDTMEMMAKWGRYDVLLMDDALLTGAQDERITDFLKDLLDYRMRYKRHQIITSQIGSAEYEEQGEKFGNATKADKQRIEALLRRIKEICRVVPFIGTAPKQGEADY